MLPVISFVLPPSWLIPLVALLLIGDASLGAQSPPFNSPPAVDFNRQVRPILSDKCFKCHGPDENARQADLRLDRREDALAVLSPDQPQESEVLRRIASQDAEEKMPPSSSKLSLTRAEIEILEQWIQQGADYQQHWAFEPISTPLVPPTKGLTWPQNEIDRFILARIVQAGLSPSPQAFRERWIRRVTFDLTGLPPSLDQIDAFLADDSPSAWEKVVDRLLASPAFGERVAVKWLDAARYSDTFGYQVDRDRFVWPWRDWVVRAFNQNMSLDQFLTWQLAGDLLPNAADEQILATTFNRLHPQKVEGGSTPEEFRVEYVADRTHTLATALMGLTLECARCHDHKFDPIGQKEYYQLFAFFNSIDEAGLYSYFTSSTPTPTLLLTDKSQKAEITQLQSQIAQAENQLKTVAQNRAEAFNQWLVTRSAEPKIPGRIAHLDFEKPPGGANKSVPGVAAGGVGWDHCPVRRQALGSGQWSQPTGKAIQLTGDDGVELKVGNFRRFEPFSLALWMNTPDVKQRAVVFHRSRAWTDAGSRGYQLLIEDGKLSASLIHFWPGNAIRVKTRSPIPIGRWVHVAVTYDGSSRAAGLAIYVNGKLAPTDIVRDNLFKNITGGGGDNITIGERFRDKGFAKGLVDEFQVFSRELTPLEAAELAGQKQLSQALQTPVEKLTDAQKTALRRYYLSAVDAEYQKQLEKLKNARQQRSKLVDPIQEIMVMRELPQPRPTFLLKRGAYDAPTTPVTAAPPAALGGWHDAFPKNRLGLARWLTHRRHPLTARVMVNHLWSVCFGNGLVRTPEDFGSQGQAPTHPHLLDWLAQDFIAGGWDVKRLVKKIVLSAAYQQSSSPPATLRAEDPENRLLAYAPRFRLSAEMIRDNALAVSGLLDRKIGGPPAKPYELAVSFKPLKPDQGRGLYRRSLYTFWKRTAPAPVMMALDASKRDVCTVKRERTSTPLQSLVLLNDPQFVEAAKILAERLIRKHQQNTSAAVHEMFRLLTSRRPTQKEQTVLLQMHREQLDYFEAQAPSAKKFLKTGHSAVDPALVAAGGPGGQAAQLAALATVASALLNFDECVMRR